MEERYQDLLTGSFEDFILGFPHDGKGPRSFSGALLGTLSGSWIGSRAFRFKLAHQ